MIITSTSRRWLFAVLLSILAVLWFLAWRAPAIGLFYDDAVNLVAARALAAGRGYSHEGPPLFPAALAVFTLVSGQTQWLKLLPLMCTILWLVITWKVLRRIGASHGAALAVIAFTAASPMVISLGTNLLPESLFALLTAAALLALLADRPLMAGVCAGLATLAQPGGIALIVSCMFILAGRRRFRGAILFTGAAMGLAGPWFGWSLAHRMPGQSLAANERLALIARNFITALEAPVSLLTGLDSFYAAVGTVVLLGWCLYRRRQLLPDLFLVFYALAVLGDRGTSEALLAPVLPLILWIFWRAIRTIPRQEAVMAALLILVALVCLADANQLLREKRDAQTWGRMRTLFAYIQSTTAPDAVILANLDAVFYLNTGRKSIRGFSATATPEQLSAAIFTDGAGYVAVTPESPTFRKSAEALERGGILDPIAIPGLLPEYRLLKTTSLNLAR